MTIREVLPAVKAARLGAELRQRREDLGWSQRRAGSQLLWDAARISKIENARVPISAEDLGRMLDVYGVTGAARVELEGLTREGRRNRWVRDYASFLSPVAAQYAALEAEAALLQEVQWSCPPGVLQEESYRRTLLEDIHTPDQVDAFMEMWAFRTERLRTEPMLHVHAVVGEWMRLIDTGGEEVMRRQYQHLIDLSELPNVTIQVTPVSAGRKGVYPAGISILQFPDQGDPSFAFTESVLDGFLLQESKPARRAIERLFRTAVSTALPPDASADLIKSWMK